MYFIEYNMKKYFPYISYYFHIPKIFNYFFYSLEKIGIDEKVICYHNISNWLWKKMFYSVRNKNLENITNSRPYGLEFANFFLNFFPHTRTIFSHSTLEQLWQQNTISNCAVFRPILFWPSFIRFPKIGDGSNVSLINMKKRLNLVQILLTKYISQILCTLDCVILFTNLHAFCHR